MSIWLGDFSFLFLSILLEGAPFILLGTIISGFLDAYLPAGTMERLLPRNKVGAVLVSGLLGIICGFKACDNALCHRNVVAPQAPPILIARVQYAFLPCKKSKLG